MKCLGCENLEVFFELSQEVFADVELENMKQQFAKSSLLAMFGFFSHTTEKWVCSFVLLVAEQTRA